MDAVNVKLASCWTLTKFKYFHLMSIKMPLPLIPNWLFSSCNAAEKLVFKAVEYIPRKNEHAKRHHIKSLKLA